MYNKAQKIRLAIVFFIYLLLLILVIFRLLDLQVLNNKSFTKLADAQHLVKLTIYPQRGFIYDRDKRVLALSLKVFSVYADPQNIKDKESTAAALSKVLGMDESWVLKRISRDKSFVWIKRWIKDSEANQIKKLKLPGVELLKENKRYYPNGSSAAHVIGFAGIDQKGLAGVELYYNKELKGQRGRKSLLRDARQRLLPAFEYENYPAINGYNIILTIDEVIQHIAEDDLAKAIEKNHALDGSVVVMDPYTGEILALANYPTFNLNKFPASTAVERRDRAVCDFYEPGSTFKTITVSAALEDKVVTPDDKFFCENGAYRVAGHVLHDHKPMGTLTVTQIVEESSNIGAVKIGQKLGDRRLYNYIRLYGFGSQTGIDLPSETPGYFRDLAHWSRLSIAAIPMGQEIGVSVIQMVRAVSAIANGGKLVTPHIMKEITDNHGAVIRKFASPPEKRVISGQISQEMKKIMATVVAAGTGVRAQLDGYTCAGKTGTSQKLNANGAYSHSKFVGSFIGFAPVEHPRFVIAVVFDQPHPQYYGGTVAAPVFKDIAEKILRYMDVPKDKK